MSQAASISSGRAKIIAIVGPTASGKSSMAVWLAKRMQGGACGAEIISADSRQVYKGLDIATGKVTRKEMQGIPHHLLDVSSPKKQFTVDNFVRLASKAYSIIRTNKRIAIVVGGTGLYIDMLLGRAFYPAVPPNKKLRGQLEQRTTEQLFTQLKKLDPRRSKMIEPEHKRRLIRAIEIARATGKNSEPQGDALRRFNVLWLGLSPTPEKLKKNIHLRLLSRMKAGMIREAKKLHNAGLSYKRMESLGLEYRSLARFLQKKITREALLQEIERGNLHYSKRQLRWFRRNKDIRWVSGKTEALRLAKDFIKVKP